MLQYSYLYEINLVMCFIAKFQSMPISMNKEVKTCLVKKTKNMQAS